MFQSLFFWNHCLDQTRLSSDHDRRLVSILVFLEPLLRPNKSRLKFSVDGFQSLFFWNHCLDSSAMNRLTVAMWVSILVFLEPLLRRYSWSIHQAESGGVSILVFLEPLLRLNSFFGVKNAHPVSILVFLEPLLRPTTHDLALLRPSMFQSLFFWNHCLDSAYSSLLVVLVQFQSLFFWNHCLDFLYTIQDELLWNVSILVFLEPLLRRRLGYPYPHNPAKFQSLFFWNHCLDSKEEKNEWATRTFQSLFFWNHCLDFLYTIQDELLWNVPILVFLEPLLRRRLGYQYPHNPAKLQSLFFWNHCLDS